MLGRVNKLDVGGGFHLMWTEADAGGQPRIWTWHPETRREITEARRFYDAARGVGPDAPPGRRIRRGSAVERTPEEREYLAAILNRPDDDRPYLEYADWLEEHGDPYGAFLRVSTATEGPKPPPDGDPLWRTHQALLDAHAERWIKPLCDLGFQPEVMGHRFPQYWYNSRGTIQEFTIDRPGILPENAVRFFSAVPLLRRLNLQDRDIDFGAVTHLPAMAQVEELTSWNVTAPQMLAACRSPYLGKLRKLDVGMEVCGEALGEAGGRALGAAAWLPQVEWLKLTYSQLGEQGVRELALSPGVARLKFLDLSNADDYGVGLVAVATSKHLAGLESLNWNHNFVHPETLSFLRDAPFRGKLRELDLGFCGPQGLGRDGTERLAAVDFPRLERLDFGINRLNNGGMAALAAAAWLAGLKHLDLFASGTGDAELAELARCHLPKLKTLKLSQNEFADAGVTALCRGPAWPCLKSLDLSRLHGSDDRPSPPGPDAAHAFAATTRFPNLEELDAQGWAIGPAGAEALARSPGLTKLKRLHVTGDLVGPAGKKALTHRFGDSVVTF